ncbi:hypothetical protein AAD001_12830 [Colwelliaceae bacterium 6471]
MKNVNNSVKKRNVYLMLATLIMLTSASDNHKQRSCLLLDSRLYNQQTQICKGDYLANRNWFAWIMGGSRSPHFHFLDLVELLHSKNNINPSIDK